MSDVKDPNHTPDAPKTTPAKEFDRRSLLRGSVAGLTVLSAGAAGGQALAAEGAPLVLKHDNLRDSVASLFELMNEDSSLRQTFINNPSQVVLGSILPKNVDMPSPQRVSEANRFLFSLLANDEFRDWARNYQGHLNEQMASGRLKPENVDKMKLAQDMAEAFGRYGDTSLLVSLGNQAALPDSPALNVEVTIETYIAIAAVIFLIIFAIDITPFNSGEYTDRRLNSAEIRGIADQLVNQAKQKRRAGELADPSSTP